MENTCYRSESDESTTDDDQSRDVATRVQKSDGHHFFHFRITQVNHPKKLSPRYDSVSPSFERALQSQLTVRGSIRSLINEAAENLRALSGPERSVAGHLVQTVSRLRGDHGAWLPCRQGVQT